MIVKKPLKIVILITSILLGCNGVKKEKPFTNRYSKPQLLGSNIISTSNFHESVNFYDSDEHIIYFTRSDKEFKTSTLYSSKFENGNIWSKPEKLSFSGEYYDAGFSFFSKKETAYFTSKRDPMKKGLSKEWNIWKVQKSKGKWGKPEVLAYPINSDSSDCCFIVNEKGQALFSSNRDGSWDIYQCEISNNSFNGLKKLTTKINSNDGEWPGFINNQGNILVFSSIRKSGVGGDDLYVSQKNGETWSKPIILDTIINSTGYEDSPLITQDGNFLLFSSWKKTKISEGVSNIYYFNLSKDLSNVLEQK